MPRARVRGGETGSGFTRAREEEAYLEGGVDDGADPEDLDADAEEEEDAPAMRRGSHELPWRRETATGRGGGGGICSWG